MKVFERPVRFQDVDAVGIVFFATFLGYCHDAMEGFFDEIPGGYSGLIASGTAFPIVDVHASYTGSLAYGDVARIETSVLRIGTTSVTFRFVMKRLDDDVEVARIDQVNVATRLGTDTKLAKIAHPPACRELFAAHLATS